MQNSVPIEKSAVSGSLAERSAERATADRRAASADAVARLVEASFRLIRETGRLEPRVGEIVQAAGLSNQAFYRHFRSKDELLLVVLDEGIRRLGGYLRHRMETAASPEEAVRRWLEGVLEQALQPEAAAATRPFAVSRARLSELFPDEVRDSETQLTGMLRNALAAARASGALPRCDPERDAETLYDLAMGWLQRRLAEPRPAERVDAEHLVAFALHGLRKA